jgi:hypothetical protein
MCAYWNSSTDGVYTLNGQIVSGNGAANPLSGSSPQTALSNPYAAASPTAQAQQMWSHALQALQSFPTDPDMGSGPEGGPVAAVPEGTEARPGEPQGGGYEGPGTLGSNGGAGAPGTLTYAAPAPDNGGGQPPAEYGPSGVSAEPPNAGSPPAGGGDQEATQPPGDATTPNAGSPPAGGGDQEATQPPGDATAPNAGSPPAGGDQEATKPAGEADQQPSPGNGAGQPQGDANAAPGANSQEAAPPSGGTEQQPSPGAGEVQGGAPGGGQPGEAGGKNSQPFGTAGAGATAVNEGAGGSSEPGPAPANGRDAAVPSPSSPAPGANDYANMSVEDLQTLVDHNRSLVMQQIQADRAAATAQPPPPPPSFGAIIGVGGCLPTGQMPCYGVTAAYDSAGVHAYYTDPSNSTGTFGAALTAQLAYKPQSVALGDSTTVTGAVLGESPAVTVASGGPASGIAVGVAVGLKLPVSPKWGVSETRGVPIGTWSPTPSASPAPTYQGGQTYTDPQGNMWWQDSNGNYHVLYKVTP